MNLRIGSSLLGLPNPCVDCPWKTVTTGTRVPCLLWRLHFKCTICWPSYIQYVWPQINHSVWRVFSLFFFNKLVFSCWIPKFHDGNSTGFDGWIRWILSVKWPCLFCPKTSATFVTPLEKGPHSQYQIYHIQYPFYKFHYTTILAPYIDSCYLYHIHMTCIVYFGCTYYPHFPRLTLAQVLQKSWRLRAPCCDQ